MNNPQQKEEFQSLIDPNEFAQEVIKRLDAAYPEFRGWNGASGMKQIENVVKQVAGEIEEKIDKQLDQHFRNMDLHKRSMLAEVRNFYEDFQQFALITGRRLPEFGNHYITADPRVRAQYDKKMADNRDSECSIGS